jgi:Macrocin-O-methyltransferase (TylF)
MPAWHLSSELHAEHVVRGVRNFPTRAPPTVRLLAGWFYHMLHDAQNDRIAALRLDGNLEECTLQALKC